MRNKEQYYYVEQSKGKRSFAFWAFIGIILFIAVYMPFFGMNLRYKLGNLFDFIFNFIGTISLLAGFFYFIMGVVKFFTGGRRFISNIAIGLILLWIGSWLTGTIILLLGAQIGQGASSGYH